MTRIKLHRADNGLHVATIGLSCGAVPGRINVSGVGDTKASALAKAAGLAERVSSDPVLRALVPPQAQAAVKVAKGLASAARRGLPTLRRAWHLLSPKSRHLAHELVKDMAPKVGDVGFSFSNPFKRKKKKKKHAVRKPDRELDEQTDNEDGGDDEGDE